MLHCFPCLEKCPEETFSPTVFVSSTHTREVTAVEDDSNIQSIVLWLIFAAILLISCLTVIWWCIYTAWKRRIKPVPETQALISDGIELQQVIVGSELPNEGIAPQNLLWDQRTQLAGGQFGDVYKCLYRNNDQYFYVAVKVARDNAPDAFHEGEFMSRLNHPHIVRLIATMIHQNIILITPLRRNNLKDFIHYTNGLSIAHKIRYCQQISNGMSYLAFRKIVHCDLKARNILVVNENWIEISDFGLAKRMGNQRKGTMGTITHTAIELFDGYGAGNITNDENTEVWSFGVVMWEIFDTTNTVPYKLEVPSLTDILLFDFLKRNGVLSVTNWPKDISPSLSTLMYKCFIRNKPRPTFKFLWISFSSMLCESLDVLENHVERNNSPENSLIVQSFILENNTFQSFMTANQ
uniref:Protein kinase domain-containing protein n=1 Tax=Panagrolaimus davidi TaxID=227884 RepID=A0A914PCE8_9BILA